MSPIYFEENLNASMYLEDKEITKIYIDEDLVYQKKLLSNKKKSLSTEQENQEKILDI